MEETVFNPQKTRLETIQVEYKKENTTWFEEYTNNQDIYRITDFDGGLLIKEWDYMVTFLFRVSFKPSWQYYS